MVPREMPHGLRPWSTGDLHPFGPSETMVHLRC